MDDNCSIVRSAKSKVVLKRSGKGKDQRLERKCNPDNPTGAMKCRTSVTSTPCVGLTIALFYEYLLRENDPMRFIVI
jgi:hypothetical protein